MRRVLLFVVGLLALASVAVASGATQARPRWVITDLGTLGSNDAHPYAINNRNQIVGSSGTRAKGSDGYSLQHAFLWQGGKMTDLGTLGGRESSASDINDEGQVVGWADTKAKVRDGYPIAHAFLWEDGRMRDLGTLGGPRSSASAINDKGQVAGYASVRSGASHLVIWEKAKIRDLGRPHYTNSVADSNNRGQVVITGTCDCPGEDPSWTYLWQGGKLTDLGDLPGADSTWGTAINESGQIVGASLRVNRGDVPHAFLWEQGRMRKLGTLGGRESTANGINDQAQVVGQSTLKGGAIRAFLWQAGTMTDLGTLGARAAKATAISDQGQVVGTVIAAGYRTRQGVVWFSEHAVLWTLKR